MVRIKDNLKGPSVDLWYYADENADKGEYIGHMDNEIQYHDVRLQIKEQQLTGYRIYYKATKELIKIDKDGNLEHYPKGLYDQVVDILMKML